MSTTTPPNAFARPHITVARDAGSGGGTGSSLGGEKMGLTFVYEQIVDEVVKSTK